MIIVVAMIECIMDDFVRRIQQRVSDPLPEITPEVVEQIKYKRTDHGVEVRSLEQFVHYIHQARKHNLFCQSALFYDVLEFMMKVRNRVHIQNKKRALEEDEHDVFTEKRLHLAEKVFEIVLETMVKRYPRGDSVKRDINDFPFPWRTKQVVAPVSSDYTEQELKLLGLVH